MYQQVKAKPVSDLYRLSDGFAFLTLVSVSGMMVSPNCW
ncbi:hypothetical protein ACZ87_03232 [Candidatus Erwinia dacicola]|uniref:Uncharacterized protein n=1 Tax=Candidatus Erwinia dacicola TaxID=252393 RepID=A0A328TKP4_9GAMM|nr:hypothetical protein ACZ87_03232 [Candidatus Erwinia dacicola]